MIKMIGTFGIVSLLWIPFRAPGISETILFVKHALGSLKRFCTRAVWLHKGVIRKD